MSEVSDIHTFYATGSFDFILDDVVSFNFTFDDTLYKRIGQVKSIISTEILFNSTDIAVWPINGKRYRLAHFSKYPYLPDYLKQFTHTYSNMRKWNEDNSILKGVLGFDIALPPMSQLPFNTKTCPDIFKPKDLPFTNDAGDIVSLYVPVVMVSKVLDEKSLGDLTQYYTTTTIPVNNFVFEYKLSCDCHTHRPIPRAVEYSSSSDEEDYEDVLPETEPLPCFIMGGKTSRVLNMIPAAYTSYRTIDHTSYIVTDSSQPPVSSDDLRYGWLKIMYPDQEIYIVPSSYPMSPPLTYNKRDWNVQYMECVRSFFEGLTPYYVQNVRTHGGQKGDESEWFAFISPEMQGNRDNNIYVSYDTWFPPFSFSFHEKLFETPWHELGCFPSPYRPKRGDIMYCFAWHSRSRMKAARPVFFFANDMPELHKFYMWAMHGKDSIDHESPYWPIVAGLHDHKSSLKAAQAFRERFMWQFSRD